MRKLDSLSTLPHIKSKQSNKKKEMHFCTFPFCGTTSTTPSKPLHPYTQILIYSFSPIWGQIGGQYPLRTTLTQHLLHFAFYFQANLQTYITLYKCIIYKNPFNTLIFVILHNFLINYLSASLWEQGSRLFFIFIQQAKHSRATDERQQARQSAISLAGKQRASRAIAIHLNRQLLQNDRPTIARSTECNITSRDIESQHIDSNTSEQTAPAGR